MGQNPQALARLRLRKAPRSILSDYAATLLTESASPDREDLIRLISLDPLMAVWILKRANSSYYGIRSTVDNLTRAIDVLDEASIAGMFADTFGAQNASVSDLPSEAPDALTCHSVATAILSVVLSEQDADGRGFAFTAGLLHDIGKHVFSLNYPAESSRMYSSSSLWESLQGAELGPLEQSTFGLDHREVGEYVARKMHFPESLITVLSFHASPSSLPPQHPAFRMARIVNAASYAATGLGYAGGESVSWDQCKQDPRWLHLIDEKLTPWDSTDSIFLACERAVSSIDEFLDFEVDRSKTLMKSDCRTNRENRAPVTHARATDQASDAQGKTIDTP